MEKYNIAIETLKDVIENHYIELHDVVNEFDYIIINNRVVWITRVNGNNLYGIEQDETLEECEKYIKNRIKS